MAVGIPLGPYRLVRRLAAGGMAEIFLARHEGKDGFARDLVVKRILPHLAADPEFTRMFRDEARLAAQLSHPNVVHVYDFGSEMEDEGEVLWLAMELVRGVDLRALIVRAVEEARGTGRDGALPPHHAAKIVSIVCEALAHAHALRVDGKPAGVVHRDVTPSNVLVSFDGAVKLADFGIAKARAKEGREATEHGVVKGKLAYLSPEQARGEALDARSDLFNVGILLFESVLGEPLFPHDDFRRAKMLSAAGRVPGLERLERIPPPLARVIKRALAPKREDRYADALALRADLEAYLRTCIEPSDTVEIGRFVRYLFPDALEEDARAPRAAGTVAATGAIKFGTQVVPPSQELDLDAASTVVGGAPQIDEDEWDARTTERPKLKIDPFVPPPHDPDPTPRLGFAGIDPPRPPSALRTSPTERSRRGMRLALIAAAAMVTLGSVVGIALITGGPPGGGGTMIATPIPDEPPIVPPVPVPPVVPVRAPAPAELRVTSAPTSGELFVDARPIGATPQIVQVTAGVHRIEVRDAAGAILASEVVEIGEGEVREIALSLPAPEELATLRVDSTPPGAIVNIDGFEAGTTPLIAQVTPGVRRVDLELEGYEEAGSEVELARAGSEATLAFALTRARGGGTTRRPPPRGGGESGQLTIATTPWSEVYLGSRHLGTTPLANVRLPAGSHTLTLRAPGRSPQRTTVTIRDGEVTRVRLVL